MKNLLFSLFLLTYMNLFAQNEIKDENMAIKKMADIINDYTWNNGKDLGIEKLLKNNPAVWDYINVPKLIAYICSDSIKLEKKCTLLSSINKMPSKFSKEKKELHYWIIANIKNNDNRIFHDLHDYWNNEFGEPLLEIFDNAEDDLICYANAVGKWSNLDSLTEYKI